MSDVISIFKRALAFIVPVSLLVACTSGYEVEEQPEYTTPSPYQQTAQVPAQGAIGARTAGTGGLQTASLQVGGQNRTYHYFAPASQGSALPVVIAYHGGGGKATTFAERNGLVGMAQRYNMILVLPQGTSGRAGGGGRGGGTWNAGGATPQGFAERNGVDDIGFTRALIQTISGSLPVDRNRIYAIGFSKGGMMAYHAACTLGQGEIKAVAAVAATLSAADCRNGAGISLLHIHGTNDENVPFRGGSGNFTARAANWPGVERGIGLFTAASQCTAARQSSNPATDTSCTTQTCGSGAQVQLCMVQGGGHAWPGGQPARWQQRRQVYVSPHFTASDYIAQFLLNS